jgi:UDP-3-O-[3-hydroxymyristoyl] glucosamine N-acyltransferase
VLSLTADDVAAAVGGELIGEGTTRVEAVAPLDRAGATDLSFLASPKYLPLFARSSAGVVLVTRELAGAEGRIPARIIVDQPHEALLALIPKLYAPPVREPGVDASARIGRGATLGEGVSIDAHVTIGAGARIGDRVWIGAQSTIGEGVTVGSDSRIHPSVTVYPGASIGERVQLHAGAVVGSEGFGYVFAGGSHRRLPHVGRCILENDVEVGANTTIDRGSIDDTVIGAGTKIDNLVHIAHNVRLGKLCLVLAQVGIAGSTRIDDGVILGGQAGVAGHSHIGKGAKIAARAGVFGDVPPGESWSGYPARPHREALRAQAALFKLSSLLKRIERFLGPNDRDS